MKNLATYSKFYAVLVIDLFTFSETQEARWKT